MSIGKPDSLILQSLRDGLAMSALKLFVRRTHIRGGIDIKKRRIQATIGISLLLLVIMLLTAYASDVANRYYGPERYKPKNPQEVEILWKKPNRDFVVIADFQSRGESPEAIRKKAAQIGADAVIISILGGLYSYDEEWADNDRYSDTYNRITGTAIKYK